MPESTIQRLFLLHAPAALPTLRLFRRNTGMALYTPADGSPARRVHYGIKGQCDLFGIVRGGQHIELELKSKNGRLSPEQAAWRDWCLSYEVPWVMLQAERGEAEESTVDRWCGVVRGMVESGP